MKIGNLQKIGKWKNRENREIQKMELPPIWETTYYLVAE